MMKLRPITKAVLLVFPSGLAIERESSIGVIREIPWSEVISTTKRGVRSEKVYFLNRTTAEPGQSLTLTKAHPLRSTGTAAVRPGAYAIEIQVNGRRFPAVEFQILDPADIIDVDRQ